MLAALSFMISVNVRCALSGAKSGGVSNRQLRRSSASRSGSLIASARWVSTIPRPWLAGTSNGSPNKVRNRPSWADRAGWLMCNCCAALVTLPCFSSASREASSLSRSGDVSNLVIRLICIRDLTYSADLTIITAQIITLGANRYEL